MSVWLIVPALDEERSLPLVLRDVPDVFDGVIVVDNGSTDGTVDAARAGGARVVREPRRGYGSACLAGIAALPAGATVVGFVDGDYSDHPAELARLVARVTSGDADLVIGSRVLGRRERGALAPQARFGNWLATRAILILFGHRFTDLGPMRVVRRDALEALRMRDPDFGWTVEMQVRALLAGLRVAEVPVSYRPRIGRSKITGTLKGSLLAGYKILGTILALRFRITR